MKLIHHLNITIVAILLCFVTFGIQQTHAAPAEPTVVKVTPNTLKAAIAKNRGKVVIVNFWAAWCQPCHQDLLALSQLVSKNSKKGVVVILVTLEVRYQKQFVVSTLKKTGHKTSFYMSESGDIEDWNDFFRVFDPPRAKEEMYVPTTYIYNKAGKREKYLTGAKTLKEYQQLISPYL